jgi:hypothetical protein
MEKLIRAVERRYPGTKVAVDSYVCPDGDETIKWWLWILNCPGKQVLRAQRWATELSFDLHGWNPPPWFVEAVSRKDTRRRHAERWVRASRGRRLGTSPARLSTRSRRRSTPRRFRA